MFHLRSDANQARFWDTRLGRCCCNRFKTVLGGSLKIEVKNCNSVDQAAFELESGRLNIKYGPNGIGKTTIARAVAIAAQENADFSPLLPFKYRGKTGAGVPKPEVAGCESIKSVFVFNEEYVNQFVFMQDEVVKDSFNIFIKSADYDAKMQVIENSFAAIKGAFDKNEHIAQVIKDLAELSESFGKSQSGYSKAGKLHKGFGGGNKRENIPAKLVAYTGFIKSELSSKWISWQQKGNDFLEIGTDCPYCAGPIEGKKETILAVAAEYDAKAIDYLIALQAIFDRLGKYFSNECRDAITKIVKSSTELSKEQINYLIGLKGQVDTLRIKLEDLRAISFFSLKDIEAIEDKLKTLKIDLPLLERLKSEETETLVSQINASLDEVLRDASTLKGEINKQKRSIQKAIQKYKDQINEFLKDAGYRYVVDIQAEAGSYKMKMLHVEYAGHIEDGSKRLSFGERNAFSIVLFMYECLTRNPDLVILDDPISSFDKSKKFALLKKLFRGKESLQGRTVLMLTHDLEPVIDMVRSLGHSFQPMPVAGFFTAANGVVTERAIGRDDLVTFAQICAENIATAKSGAVKAIYLRRHFEILDDKGFAYHLLSSLLHRKAAPEARDATGNLRPMETKEIDEATAAIKGKCPSFDYGAVLSELQDDASLRAAYRATTNGYERLQLFRLIEVGGHENDVIKKYVNESFHIENEQVIQLNPHRYDWVPGHIVAECDKALDI